VPVKLQFPEQYNFTMYAPNDATGVNSTNAYTLAITPTSIQIALPAQVLLIKIATAQN
jgi:hypothetical protein